ncbi:MULTISPECIES: YceI family protein [Kocuria]|uniref:YceI family protein n=1 Tax=Kocuria subflava TaxID=1736139 RepID=A0A846TVQ9_9MICC|nr:MULTISPECIES: YceI family protein [Kocuria]NKE09317.1 YceI family protein [Kocuria subflava]
MNLESQFSGHWNIDPAHSRIGFSTRHAMVTKVRGAFNDVQGFAEIDPHDLTRSTVEVKLRVESIDTRDANRDAHLKSEDFFHAEDHPYITFASSAIDEVDEGQFIVSGDLTIRDITRPITIPLELTGIDTDPFGQTRAGLEGSRRIDRKDWGVQWNTPLDSGGVLVSDKVTLEFELSLIKDQEAPAETGNQTS